MARNYTTGLIITGDSSGAVRATALTDEALGRLNTSTRRASADQVSAWDRVRASMMGYSAALGGISFAVLAREMLNVNRQMETLRATLVLLALWLV